MSDTVTIRLMQAEDFESVVTIDGKIRSGERREYYRNKFDKMIHSGDFVPTSMVAEDETGKVVGFVMGELFAGEYGLEETATLDTIGVDPDCQRGGVGQRLIEDFTDHLKSLGVMKISTLVHWNDGTLINFFSHNQFSPSKTVNLEREL